MVPELDWGGLARSPWTPLQALTAQNAGTLPPGILDPVPSSS